LFLLLGGIAVAVQVILSP